MKLFQLTRARWPDDMALLCQPGDALLLRQDAVHLLRQQRDWPGIIYVLQQDLAARGLACPPYAVAVDDAGWVRLCTEASQVILCQS